jgi:hypothetical protein
MNHLYRFCKRLAWSIGGALTFWRPFFPGSWSCCMCSRWFTKATKPRASNRVERYQCEANPGITINVMPRTFRVCDQCFDDDRMWN